MPSGKLNCCSQPAHCGIVWSYGSWEFIGTPGPLPGDEYQTYTLDGATATGPEKTAFSQLTAAYGFQNPPGKCGNDMPACSYFKPTRWLREDVRYYGKVWSGGTLHDFDYTHTRELDFSLPSPRSYIKHERAINIDDDAYDWEIDADTGTVTETGGTVEDVIYTAPGLGESDNPIIPISEETGSAELTITPFPESDAVEIVLTISVPEDYHAAGSPAYTRTVRRLLSNEFTRATFEAACNFMLGHVKLADGTHVYTSDDSTGSWNSESAWSPYNKRICWGYEYGVKWSCEDDDWPNRVLVFEGDVLRNAVFVEAAAQRVLTNTHLTLLRSRFGVAEGDTGCITCEKYDAPEEPDITATAANSDPCTLSGGGNATGAPYINCHAAALGPGNYNYVNAGDFAYGTQSISRRYQMDGIGGLVVEYPDCVDSLAAWDGTNPDPTGYANECCWPTPP